MQLIQRVSEPSFERRGAPDNRVRVRFKLNRQPDETWIGLFKAHAASSALGAANAVVNGTDVSIEVATPRNASELATALDCFIECANLRLRSWGFSERTPTAPPDRRRLRSHP